MIHSPADKANYATHDQNLMSGRDSAKKITHDNMQTTASGTLSNLIESIKEQAEVKGSMPKPQKQAKKYKLDLGQNVSDFTPPPLRMNKRNRFPAYFRVDHSRQKTPMGTHWLTCLVRKASKSKRLMRRGRQC